MPVFHLTNDIVFPPPEYAEADGLLAVGGDLSPSRLLNAYKAGIFPWYAEGEPLLWWSPAPRLVLFPQSFHLSRRLGRTLRGGRFRVSADCCFADVIRSCADTRLPSRNQTWITPAMQEAYCHMHQLGYAHSVECWQGSELVGGLYGLTLDRVFFGESMFSRIADASKVALAALAIRAPGLHIDLIDCQMRTEHLARLGAVEVPRAEFQRLLARLIIKTEPQEPWQWESRPLPPAPADESR